MTIRQIREKAQQMKIPNYSRMTKEDLIRSIQKTEGNDVCFRSNPDCKQMDCCWMDDCMSC